jgi:hypothetical protein
MFDQKEMVIYFSEEKGEAGMGQPEDKKSENVANSQCQQ